MDFVHDPISTFYNFLWISFIRAYKWNRIPLQFLKLGKPAPVDSSIISCERIQFPGAGRRTARECLLLLLHRFNLPAQDCVRLLHLISSARITILDHVLGTFLPNKRHLHRVSNCCDSALAWELWSHHSVLLHLDFQRNGWEMWRRWFVASSYSVFLLQWVHSQGWSWCWRNNPCETQTLSNRKEPWRAPPIQVAIVIPPMLSLNCPIISQDFLESSHTRTSSCFFLHGCVEANLFLRNLVLLCPRTPSAISASRVPMDWCIRLSFQLRTNIVTILEIAVERDPPLYEQK